MLFIFWVILSSPSPVALPGLSSPHPAASQTWESSGPSCPVVPKELGLPYSSSSPSCCAQGWSQITPPFGVRGRRFDGNSGSCALLTNMFLLPLLLLSASDGPDSGNWEQLPFFSELTEQQLSAWGCMDVRGGQAQVPPGEVKSVWQQLCCSSAGKGQCGTGKLSPWHGSLLELHICDLRGVFMCMHVRPSPLLACQ